MPSFSRRQEVPFSNSTLPIYGDTSSGTPSGGNSKVIIAIVAVVLSFGALLVTFGILRYTRRRHSNPKYIPTSFLKNLWRKWDLGTPHYRLPDTNEHLEPRSGSRMAGLRSAGRSTQELSSAGATAGTANNGIATVDRNTSVRSVMTLPAYNQNPMHNEQVLGREGERGGIDVVVEFPEGIDEEEARREEEMEALYQVRLARRRENEEREERRRLRREARERGDFVALRELQARSRAGSNVSAERSASELAAEHERIKNERLRAVSSVSYADLGVARHDGTRLRANSVESERDGLLGDAASFAAGSHYHRRERSASSVLSIDTMNSDMPSPRLTRSREYSRGESPPVRRSSNEERAGSSPEMIEHDDNPLNSPPGYENISLDTAQDEHQLEPPPDYSSPILARGEERARFEVSGTQLDTTPATATPRRASGPHIGHLIAGSGSSNSSNTSTTRPAPESRHTTRGVGGVPQLPSLRLASLPSIKVDPGSPRFEQVFEEDEHHPEE